MKVESEPQPDSGWRDGCGSVDAAGLRAAISLEVCGVLGTEVAANAALMSMGLDSIAAVEFTSAVGEAVGTSGFSAIMLFDHPTVDSIASYLAA